MRQEQKIITIRRARAVPVLLAVLAVAGGITHSLWWLLALPFVGVGWICAVPNLNLIDGMLAYLSMVGGFILLHFHEASGTAIVLGTMTAFYLCAVEMRVTTKPYVPDENNTNDQPNNPSHHTAESRAGARLPASDERRR